MRTPVRAGWILAAALVVLIGFEVLRIYWIMPFPGSQGGDTVRLAYGLHQAIWWVRWLGLAVVVWAARRMAQASPAQNAPDVSVVGATTPVPVRRAQASPAQNAPDVPAASATTPVPVRRRSWAWLAAALGLVAYGCVAYQANGPMSADVMFRQPTALVFAKPAAATLDPEALVVGVALAPAGGGPLAARAYPIRVIGYHHQVRDEVAGEPVMVTYCTVCRTGRVFSPRVEDRVEEFRLVGMDHWNAMFEDGTTGSWWRQATGEAVVGPRRGQRLAEIPSRQMSWAAWLELHPESDVLEPDPSFADRYERLVEFEAGTNESELTGRDAGSWNEKSWVVGVLAGEEARAFDWNELATAKAINDRVGAVPVVLLLAADGRSFHAYDARVDGAAAPVELDPAEAPAGTFRDRATGASWSAAGRALDGPQAGAQLTVLPAYQEFWHSWRTFRPATTARR